MRSRFGLACDADSHIVPLPALRAGGSGAVRGKIVLALIYQLSWTRIPGSVQGGRPHQHLLVVIKGARWNESVCCHLLRSAQEPISESGGDL